VPQDVEERKQRVHVVKGWAATAFAEEEVFFLMEDELVEDAEICAGRITL